MNSYHTHIQNKYSHCTNLSIQPPKRLIALFQLMKRIHMKYVFKVHIQASVQCKIWIAVTFVNCRAIGLCGARALLYTYTRFILGYMLRG